MQKTTNIYALVDPETREIRYCGKANNPASRLIGNFKKPCNSETRKWFDSLRERGLYPEIQIVEIVDSEKWEEREIYWIAEFRRRGFSLTNKSVGGGGPGFIPSKPRPDQSRRMKGTTKPAAWRAALSASLKASPKMRAHLVRLHAAKKGVPRPESTRLLLSEALKASPVAAAARAAVGLKRRGRPMHPNCAAAIIAARKGTPLTPEHCAAISASKKGRKATPEHKAALSAARQEYIERFNAAVASGLSKTEARALCKLPPKRQRKKISEIILDARTDLA